MITQCPDCQTRFRLPLDQVATSRGEVFCGECHTQFNALDYLVIEEGTKQEKPTLIDRAQQGDEKEPVNTLFLPIDENTIANLLSGGSTSESSAEEKSGLEQNPVAEEASPRLTPIAQSSAPDFTDTLIQQALQSREILEEPPESDRIESHKGASDKPEDTDESELSPAPTRRETERYQLKQNLEEPATGNQRPLWSTILSLVAIMLLVTTIGLQYLVIQREHFSQHRYFRPLLTTICPHLGCNLSPKRDLSLLLIVDNTIETHPQSPGALLISAELSNQGGFEQNYPIVELVMTNIQQEVVASRHFYPDEYLPSFSEKETGRFVAHSSEQLLLEVVDPGSHATGFEFILHNNII